LNIYGLIDVGGEESACNVETIEVKIVLCGEGQKEVNSFGIGGGAKQSRRV
jgi:hypothetical protein